MNKLLKLALLLTYSLQMHAQSTSFFMPRSVTHNATLELALDNYQIYRDPTAQCADYAFYATPFYMQSHNAGSLARSFLPNNAPFLDIQENGTGNIGSLWLDLIAPPGLFFSSIMSIAPLSKTIGSYFYARFAFESLYPDACWLLKNSWFSLSFAAMQVRHTLNIQEVLTGSQVYGTIPGITTGIQAFNNPTWTAGKLSPVTLKHSGVDDIQLKLGTNYYYAQNRCRDGFYLVGTIPTGNTPHSEFLFEPLVGTRHGAFGFGIMGDCICPVGDIAQWSLMYDFKYRYLFSGHEIRSFDLAPNGDWSRYLLVVNESATSVSLPGINACTIPVNVTPGSQIEYWFAFHYAYCNWNVELGYNLWWRGRDSITLIGSFPPDTGIYDLTGAVSGTPVSASKANITESAIGPNQAPSDSVFTPSSTFNLSSGKQHSALSDSLYLAFSYNGVACDEYPWLAGIGGGYEFAEGHNALSQGSVWGKLGILF